MDESLSTRSVSRDNFFARVSRERRKVRIVLRWLSKSFYRFSAYRFCNPPTPSPLPVLLPSLIPTRETEKKANKGEIKRYSDSRTSRSTLSPADRLMKNTEERRLCYDERRPATGKTSPFYFLPRRRKTIVTGVRLGMNRSVASRDQSIIVGFHTGRRGAHRPALFHRNVNRGSVKARFR